MSSTKTKLGKNVAAIRENIAAACKKAGRDPSEVTIVAVTKTTGLEEIRQLVELGLTDLGENRAQQLAERAADLSDKIEKKKIHPKGVVRWHMIGHLQRNKVRPVLEHAAVVHSVDSLRLAEEINDRAAKMEKRVDVLLQVNCSEEDQKSGVAVGAAKHLGELMQSLSNVRLVGLMTMAAISKNPEDARPAFSRLKELFDEMKSDKIGGDAFRHLSMGMSQDYAVAVEEGATLLRIGTALFE